MGVDQRTEVSLVIHAPRRAVYQAFVEADLLAQWLAPDTMTGRIHSFDAREGGTFRMSLTYTDPNNSPGGKSSEDTDTFEGEFVELIPDEKVVWDTEFESDDPDFAGVMRLIWAFADVESGTEVTVICENIPKGIRPEDNETGSRQSLEKLARLLE